MPSFRRIALALLWYGLLLVLSVNSIYLLSRGEPLSVRKVLRLEGIRPRAEAIVQRVVGRLRAEGPPARPSSPDSAAAGTSSLKPSPEEKAFEKGRSEGQTEEDVRRALPSPGERSLGERPREYQRLFDWAARRYGVEKRLIKAVVQAESAGNPQARSHKGAIGLMQLMPRTAMRYLSAQDDIQSVKDLYLPVTNVSVGASHLAWLQGRIQALFPEAQQDLRRQVRLIAAAYNAGLGDVQRHRGVPPYRETRIYVRRVWHWYQRLPPPSSPEGK
jgi:soluble lytic murein transglycosylase-like protein